MLKSMSIHQSNNKRIVKSNFVTLCLAFKGSILTSEKWKISRRVMTIPCGKKNGTLYMTTYNCGSIAIVESKEGLNL